MSKTLVLIKPDAFERGLVSKIMEMIENKGFKISNIKIWSPAPRNLVEKHYEQYSSRPHFSGNCDFLSSNQLMSIIYEGENAITEIRILQGNRNVPGTIRGTYCDDTRRNLIHASDSEESAIKEMNIWFP
jgi:nucleoside-diphosphate kinase